MLVVIDSHTRGGAGRGGGRRRRRRRRKGGREVWGCDGRERISSN